MPHTVGWFFLQINLGVASCFTLAVVYFAVGYIVGASYNAEPILIALFMAGSALYAAIRTLRIYAADSVSEAARA